MPREFVIKSLIKFVALSLFALLPLSVAAELPPEQPLWPDSFKNDVAYDRDEAVRDNRASAASPSQGNRVFSYVSTPTYVIHQADPKQANGVGLVICPGGGYTDVWLDREGHDLAIVLQKHGITSLVLKYRTNSQQDGERAHAWEKYLPAVESDARRAISVLRDKADELNVDPKKVGVCGFSAGGNLAILASLFPPKAGAENGAPNFAGLFYPWLRDGDYEQTIHENGKNIPPLFIMNAVDDNVTPAAKCLKMYAHLLKANVKTELHFYNQGGHGFDLAAGRGVSTAMWPSSFVAWLKDEQFITESDKP